jgi:hypothetical protein
LPITQIDGIRIGTGKPGPRWRAVSDGFIALRSRLASIPAYEGP